MPYSNEISSMQDPHMSKGKWWLAWYVSHPLPFAAFGFNRCFSGKPILKVSLTIESRIKCPDEYWSSWKYPQSAVSTINHQLPRLSSRGVINIKQEGPLKWQWGRVEMACFLWKPVGLAHWDCSQAHKNRNKTLITFRCNELDNLLRIIN